MVFLELEVAGARASVPLDGSEATLGGVVQWTAPNLAGLQQVLLIISESIDLDTARSLALMGADLDAPGSPMGACDALGFGVDVSFERVAEP